MNNSIDNLGLGYDVASSSGGGTLSIWPILACIIVAGVVILIVYKKFFE